MTRRPSPNLALCLCLAVGWGACSPATGGQRRDADTGQQASDAEQPPSLDGSPIADSTTATPPTDGETDGPDMMGGTADVGPPPQWLPESMVCGVAPPVLEYPKADWVFRQPEWDDSGGGPWTVEEFRSGFVGDQAALLISPAISHSSDRNVSALWLAPGDDLVIHLGLQSERDQWEGGRISLTPLIDWEPVAAADYVWWDGAREKVKGEFGGTGAIIPMESQTEIFDLRIPSEVFEEPRHYELALAIRGRTTDRRLPTLFRRISIYAGGADRLPHPCLPPASIRELEEILPPEYRNYLAARYFGLLYPTGLPWEELSEIQQAVVGEDVAFDWFIRTHSRDRNAAFVPVADGKPVGPVTFRQIGQEGGDSMQIAHVDDLDLQIPDQDLVDVYVAEWIDPYYPPRAPDGSANYFPPDDQHGYAGVRVFAGGSFGGTNILRFRTSSE